MKTGILQCDHVPQELQPEFWNYQLMLIDLLKVASPDCEFAVYSVLHEQFPSVVNECDGYITTGSRHRLMLMIN